MDFDALNFKLFWQHPFIAIDSGSSRRRSERSGSLSALTYLNAKIATSRSRSRRALVLNNPCAAPPASCSILFLQKKPSADGKQGVEHRKRKYQAGENAQKAKRHQNCRHEDNAVEDGGGNDLFCA